MDFHRETISHHENIIIPYDQMVYKELMRKRWNYWKERPIETASELCQCLRKVCNTSPEREHKVVELARKHKKVLIFYNFDYELDILKIADYGEDFEIAE